MKLWDISRKRENGMPVYDCYDAFIIRAESEQRAREIAAEGPGDEGADVWLNPARSTCKEVAVEGAEGIVLSDFHAG